MTATVHANRWLDLTVPDIGSKDFDRSVSVVVPARNCQPALDRMLIALDNQTYPSELTEVVVVDDASDVPLTAPDGLAVSVRVVRQESDGRFGAGRARNRGAVESSGDVLVFLDADVVAGPETLERYARWHHVVPYAVVTGVLRFVDFEGITAERLAALLGEGRLAEHLRHQEADDQEWREKTFARTYDLTVEALDLFRITIGATLSVGRELYDDVGGLRQLGIRGIEDTEFGYRLQTAGGLFVLERGAQQWHQGRRFFDSKKAAEAKKAREPLVHDLLPVPGFRPRVATRTHPVPRLAVRLVGPGAPGRLRETVDSFRSVSTKDALLEVPTRPEPGGDPRIVAEGSRDPVDRGATPLWLEVPVGTRFKPEAFDLIVTEMREKLLGVGHVLDPARPGTDAATAFAARAVGRAQLASATRLDTHSGLAEAGRLFGERWVTAAEWGLELPTAV